LCESRCKYSTDLLACKRKEKKMRSSYKSSSRAVRIKGATPLESLVTTFSVM
jgi:hypothetical protein